MKNSKRKKRIQAEMLALAVFGAQCLGAFSASADSIDYKYEGTTQISSVDYYPEFDTMASALTVEEVYVSAGSFVSEGDAILKLTDDSYQSALDYYYAAILRAENNLTNEELSYTQGMQSAEYDLELALADEDQAPFVQEQSEAELTDTIEEHEEVLTEMEERIEALENGEYDAEDDEESGEALSGSSSLGGSSGGSSLGSGSSLGEDESDGTDKETLPDETEFPEADLEMTLDLETGETENPDQAKSTGRTTAGESKTALEGEDGQELIIEEEQAGAEQADSAAAAAEAAAEQAEANLQAQIEEIETQIAELEAQITDYENDIASYNEKIAGREEKIETSESEIDEYEKAIEGYKEEIADYEDTIKSYESEIADREDKAENDTDSLTNRIASENEEYNEILKEIYGKVIEDYDDLIFCGTGDIILVRQLQSMANLVEMSLTKTGSALEQPEEGNAEQEIIEEPAVIAETETAQTDASQTEAPQTEISQTEAVQMAEASEETVTVEEAAEVYEENYGQEYSYMEASAEETQIEDTQSQTMQEETQTPAVTEASDGLESGTATDAENAELLDELKELIRQLYDKEEERSRLYQDLEDTLTKAQDDIAGYQEKIDKEQEEIADIQGLIDEEEEKIADCRKSIEKKQKKNTKSRNKIIETQEEIRSLEEQIAALLQEITELEQQISEVQITALQEGNEALQLENAALKEEVEALQAQAEGLEQSASAAASSALEDDAALAEAAGAMDASALAGALGQTDAADASSLAGASALGDAAALAEAAQAADASALAAAMGLTESSEATDASALSGLSGWSSLSGLTDTSSLAGLSGMTDTSALAALSGMTGTSDQSDLAEAAQQMASETMAAQATSGSGQSLAGVQSLLGAQESESMFGNTYDLTQAKALLERTAYDADEAEELLEELYDMQDSVQLSYEELLRLRKPKQLEIQYQYDSAVFAARLAEITYEQTTAELEDELSSSQKSLSDLEEALQKLESLGDGTVRAAASGTLSAVNYSEGDTLYSMFPMYSVYDTDTVTVVIAVPQSEIAQIAVGDTVEVSIGSFSQTQGTVTEKAVEAQEGNSRTTVNYEVEISIDNSTGRLSSGSAATVTVTAQ